MTDPTISEQNRHSWNAAVPVHASHRPHLAAFLRAGGLTLFPEERELLGEVAGLRLLHLLCNTGQDTLSLAALGARATGVDLSDAAIAEARRLSAETGIAAHFVQSDVYAYLAAAPADAFERVYCGYGVICWLHDLGAFAAGVARILAPGGRFVLMEFHPLSNMFDRNWQLAYGYPSGGTRLTLPGVGDYVGEAAGGLSPGGFAEGRRDFVNPHPCHLFRWGVGEVVSALAAAGLRIVALREHPFVNGERPFARMRPAPGRRWLPPNDMPPLPLMYGLAADL
ncbi:MAG: class I SAM-dependent methyltransferase [Oscillochloridaceae bacterium]|nr:class I SAM-dependent methyltransferase [Chloroflexaceae bacterium]MDW8388933.1 class I SAM-dependent methyltransferase [Oscillochloridaceae bacterium]